VILESLTEEFEETLGFGACFCDEFDPCDADLTQLIAKTFKSVKILSFRFEGINLMSILQT